MTKCTECKYPVLCLACRTAEDHIAPDGELLEIIGCDTEQFFYWGKLTEELIAKLAGGE